uniref:Copia protein n=1 Tax=Nicotiana tabacum TaxID=4097 RepID=A0A1S3X2R3_TOBAC|nr:PREDICTED: uncharacterized protein LOC107760652 [Nicotiana tabacum]
MKYVKSKKKYIKKSLRNCKFNTMACTNPSITVQSGQTRRLTSQLEKDQPELSRLDGFGNPKMILNLVTLTNQDPSKLGYLKESDHYDLQEHHQRNLKGKWYLDSACSSQKTGDKNLFKEVTKIDGGSVKFGNDSKGKIIGIRTIPFNNNCDITEVYLVDGINYNLLSISQLCDSGYEVKFKKIGCAIEDETELTNQTKNNPPEPPKESTTHTARPNEWKNEPEYPQKFIIGDPNEGMKTRGALKKKANIALISQIEPKKIEEALKDSRTKCVFRNKLNEDGKVVRNKARLVAQGYSQQEGVDYDETFSPVARLESIRIMLAYISFKGFKLFQMDVKSAFLNGFIEEELYVRQPHGFVDSEFPYHVYKLTKALYRLKQAPKACYEILSSFLINHGFTRGKVDTTLFIKRSSEEQTTPVLTPVEGTTIPPIDTPVPPPAPAFDSFISDRDLRRDIQMLTQLVASQA